VRASSEKRKEAIRESEEEEISVLEISKRTCGLPINY